VCVAVAVAPLSLMSSKPHPVKRTVTQALIACCSDLPPSTPDIDYFELKLRPEALRSVSQFFVTANQFNRLKLQGSYGVDLALICSSPVCVFGRLSESEKLQFCSAMQTKGSTFRPSVNPKRVVSSSKSVYVEDLIESLESTGITFVIIAAAGTKCQHTSLNDLVQNLHSQYGLGNGFLDLATYLEPNDSDVMPLLSASPSLKQGNDFRLPDVFIHWKSLGQRSLDR
jgi:hypothetical protein